MDDKAIQLLQQIADEQKQQTELLRRNLWRIKFSLFSLLLLMTIVGVGLGLGLYWFRGAATKTIVIPAGSLPQPAPAKVFDAPIRVGPVS